MPSVYVSVPSISDTEFIKTLQRCLVGSSGENVVNIGATGIFFTHEVEEKNYFIEFCKNNNIRFNTVDREQNQGTGVARKLAIDLYEDEDYYLQIDSHSIFMKDWDSILINKLTYLKNFLKNEKVAITAYPPEYKYIDFENVTCQNGWNNQNVSRFIDGSLLSKTNHGAGCKSCEQWEPLPLWIEVNVNTFDEDIILNPKISGAYLFADKKFVKDYKSLIKWNYAILEEELVMSIEANALGWKFYTIKGDVPVAHLYAEDINIFSGSRSHLTEDDVLELNTKQNYLNYVLDPKNRNKIEQFEKHAHVDIISLAKNEKSKNRTATLSKTKGKK